MKKLLLLAALMLTASITQAQVQFSFGYVPYQGFQQGELTGANDAFTFDLRGCSANGIIEDGIGESILIAGGLEIRSYNTTGFYSAGTNNPYSKCSTRFPL